MTLYSDYCLIYHQQLTSHIMRVDFVYMMQIFLYLVLFY